ncbi:uncharacterized protein LOC110362012 [Columba livia]|uniref:uncharacterized protein LOC110362012 n=1 Tax=Columba livia TaxID=8932 RepID=UPI0031BAEF7D
MSVQLWEMSWFLSQEAFVIFLALLWLLLVLLLFRLLLILANPQEGRPKQHQHRDNRGDVRGEQTLGKGRCPAKTPPGPKSPPPHQGMHHLLTVSPLPAAFILPETSRPSRTLCRVHPDMDPIYEIANQFNRTVENLTRYLDKLSCETSDGSESSTNSIRDSEVESSSSVLLPALKDDSHSSIMGNETISSTELCLSFLSDNSWTSLMKSNVGSSSQESLSTLVDKAPASSVQPGLEWELCLPADVDETLQDDPASALPSPQQPEQHDVMVDIIVQHMPFLDETVERELENDFTNTQVQPLCGLPTKVLENDKSPEDTDLQQKAAQAPIPRKRTLLPYCSPLQQWDVAHASSVQPALEHPRTDPEEQPGPEPSPVCEEDLASCLEASGVQQHQQELEIQSATPSPSPEVLDFQSSETESPITHHNGQDPLEDLITATELEWELGLPANVDESVQDVPTLAVPSPRQPEQHDVMVDITVHLVPFLEETVKRELENDFTNTQVQPLCGLPTKLLENDKSPEDTDLQQKAAQSPIPRKRTLLPYCSPLQQQDVAHASSVQPALEHPRTDPEEQPGPEPFPACDEDLASCLEASGVQQHQQELEIQSATPNPSPEVLDFQCRETESPITHHNGQDPLEDLITATELEWELGLPANMDETVQDVPASALPSPRQPKQHDVMVDITVHLVPFLEETVKRELENDFTNTQVQPLCGLPTKVLENDKSPEDIDLQQKAAQAPVPRKRTLLPYCSPLQQRDVAHASSVQPALEHPRTNPEEQPGPEPFPACEEDLASCLEASGVQQHQQELEIQLATTSPPPDVQDFQCRETESPNTHRNNQHPLGDLITATELEWELGLPANVDETLQDVPTLAVPSPRQPEQHDVMADPVTRDLSFLADAVKRQLERHIMKKQIEKRYGLPTKVLQYEKETSEDSELRQKAAQPPHLQRRTGLPYQPPFWQLDKRKLNRNPAGQLPLLQVESPEPVETGLLVMQAPSPPPTPQRSDQRNATVFPVVEDLDFLKEAVKRRLERHIVKLQIQKRCGWPTKVLQMEKSSEDIAQWQKAAQPLHLQRQTVLPCWQAHVHSGPEMFLGATQEKSQEHGKTPPCTREHSGTSSSMASRETDGKEKDPGTQGDVHSHCPSNQAQQALPQSKGDTQEQSGQVSESSSISDGDVGTPELLLMKSFPMGQADPSLEEHSSSNEDVGTPGLQSDLETSPIRSSPQTQCSSSEERLSALPPTPELAGTSLQIPHLELLLTTIIDYCRARKATEDVQNQLLAFRLPEPPGNVGSQIDPAAELPSDLQSRGHRGAEKDKGSTQDTAGSSSLCSKPSKAPRSSLSGKEGSHTWAPSDVAALQAGREGTVEDSLPPKDRAKRQQGQKRAAAAQQPQRVHACRYATGEVAVLENGSLLPRCAPTTVVLP